MSQPTTTDSPDAAAAAPGSAPASPAAAATSPPPASPTKAAPVSPPPAAAPTAPTAGAGADAGASPADALADALADAPADAPAAAAAPAAPAPTAPHADPKIAFLQAMFPSVDVAVIEMVLDSVGGSQDRAIESLLQMTDPEFKPDASTTQTEETTSQLNMDEEFARALHMQEQEELAQPPRLRSTVLAQERAQAHAQNPIPAVLPYQPRVRRARPPQPDPYAVSTHEHALEERYGEPPAGHGPGGDPPGMVALEEKLGQFAEAGKQTFNSLFTRAKAKYTEMAEQHAERRTGLQETAAEWRDQGTAGAGGPMVGAGERHKYGGLWGSPRPGGASPERTVSPPAPAPAPAGTGGGGGYPVPARRWSPTDAYEDPTPPRIPSPGNGAGALAGSGGASPAKTDSKIDLSKLGFLPKKKVDLMSGAAAAGGAGTAGAGAAPAAATSPPSAPGKSVIDQIPRTQPALVSPHTLGDSDDDDDDLDYTENPFEKRK